MFRKMKQCMLFRVPLRTLSSEKLIATNTKPKTPPNIQLISSKRKEFNCSTKNFFKSAEELKRIQFGDIPLSSKGWMSRQSKDDYFVVHPIEDEANVFYRTKDVSNLKENGINEKIQENLIKNFEIENLTKVQEDAIPEILKLNHLLIAAETGCGKTLAYTIPIISEVLKRKSETRELNSPLVVIISPGRELAEQIGVVCQKLSSDVKVKTLLGGNMKSIMMNPEFEDVDILVASMGAISKVTTTGIYRMDKVRHVVLDEADTLLDDSFSNKLCYFLRHFPVSRFSIIFLFKVYKIK